MILHAKKRSLPATIVCNPEIMGGSRRFIARGYRWR